MAQIFCICLGENKCIILKSGKKKKQVRGTSNVTVWNEVGKVPPQNCFLKLTPATHVKFSYCFSLQQYTTCKVKSDKSKIDGAKMRQLYFHRF